MRALLLALFLICTPARADWFPSKVYSSAKGPFYSGSYRPAGEFKPAGSPVRVMSYNVHYGRDVAGVIRALKENPHLAQADFILIQEVSGSVDGRSNTAQQIARAIGADYVFAPIVIHPETGMDYGNAILSRWPIEKIRKIVLPHPHFLKGNTRAAVGATANVRGMKLDLYSVHLETVFPDTFSASLEPSRMDQVSALLDDVAQRASERAILAGDFNNLQPMGTMGLYTLLFFNDFTDVKPWGWTFRTLRAPIDHIFQKGLSWIRSGRETSVTASDHVPIWADFRGP